MPLGATCCVFSSDRLGKFLLTADSSFGISAARVFSSASSLARRSPWQAPAFRLCFAIRWRIPTCWESPAELPWAPFWPSSQRHFFPCRRPSLLCSLHSERFSVPPRPSPRSTFSAVAMGKSTARPSFSAVSSPPLSLPPSLPFLLAPFPPAQRDGSFSL